MIDLILVEYGDGRRDMSVAIWDAEDCSKMLGPTPAKGAISVLAPMLRDARPEQFCDHQRRRELSGVYPSSKPERALEQRGARLSLQG